MRTRPEIMRKGRQVGLLRDDGDTVNWYAAKNSMMC